MRGFRGYQRNLALRLGWFRSSCHAGFFLNRCAHAMPARSPLTAASCNARVGPTAMSIIRSNCFTPPKQSRTPKLHVHQKHPSGRLCRDVFASESAAKIIPARAAIPMTSENIKRSAIPMIACNTGTQTVLQKTSPCAPQATTHSPTPYPSKSTPHTRAFAT